RGVGPWGALPIGRLRPTVIIMAGRLDPGIIAAQRRGARGELLPFFRDGFLGEHKTLNYLPSVLGKVIAGRHRAFEAVLVDGDGHVTEGTTSSIFLWSRSQLVTPAIQGILPGLTRQLLIQVAAASGTRVVERQVSTHELWDAD